MRVYHVVDEHKLFKKKRRSIANFHPSELIVRIKLEEKKEEKFIAVGELDSRPVVERCRLQVDLDFGVDVYSIAQLLIDSSKPVL